MPALPTAAATYGVSKMAHRTSTDAEILFALLHADGPATRNEIADGIEHTSAKNVGNKIVGLWRDGYVLRRTRDQGGHGKNPYEYVLADADGGEPYDGTVACGVCGRESAMFSPGTDCTNGWCEGVFEPA